MNETKDPNHHRHRPKKLRPRTIRWYADVNIGEDHSPTVAVARFYISLAPDLSPEIFFIPMMREFKYDDAGKLLGMKPQYAGDIERNAVPLSGMDVEKLFQAMAKMKADMGRKQKAWNNEPRGEVFVPPPRPRLNDHLQQQLVSKTRVVVAERQLKDAVRERLGDWKLAA